VTYVPEEEGEIFCSENHHLFVEAAKESDFVVLVAQWLGHQTSNLGVVSSSLTEDVYCLFFHSFLSFQDMRRDFPCSEKYISDEVKIGGKSIA
jgi:hypothetical protein